MRDANGRFMPGYSGNPDGRGRKTAAQETRVATAVAKVVNERELEELFRHLMYLAAEENNLKAAELVLKYRCPLPRHVDVELGVIEITDGEIEALMDALD